MNERPEQEIRKNWQVDSAQIAVTLGQQRFGLALALMERARWVQRRLDRAVQLGVDQHEETLTQSVLLDLRIELPQLSISVYTRQEESRFSGADWMWLWEGDEKWFGHLVQAKRLKYSAGGKLVYNVGYRPRLRVPQIETLLAASRRHDMPAIYALYNPSVGEWRAKACPVVPPGAAEEGITMLSADVALELLRQESGSIKDLARDLSLARIAPHARPWSCLATCRTANCLATPTRSNRIWKDMGFTEAPGDSDLAFGAALAVSLAAHSRQLSQRALRDDPVAVEAGVRSELPEWANVLVDGGTPRAQVAMPEDIRGVVMLRPMDL